MTHHPTTISAPAGLPFIDVVREFDASPSAVYKAHVDPALFAQWMGPRTIQLENVVIDARPGGRWRYEFNPGGAPMAFYGVFHNVEPNSLIIQTYEFSLAPNQPGISTTQFESVDGRTRMTVHEVYPSVEARDAAVESGMNTGVIEGYERLDELLAR